ncbi:ChbG/HpnK family deacetylase [Limnohabitans sp.]|uniref:ChbG/HpnK family deacetylase n=1 Tax=Limnohabitans sp. TaxID=1907725 RepID=UPI00286F79AA|nr:ChbG/HpnK family deacetylase [Limnohabitans sp.]
MSAQSIRDVVLCADDYAVNAPTSQGIVALVVLGRLSATSVMTLSPRWVEDAPALRDLRGRLDVGLHLDWTSSFAQSAGFGGALSTVMRRAALRRFDVQVLRDEIERQLDAFEQHWHAAPDHIDGHQHVHQFAGLRDALFEVLLRRYGRAAPRPWLRISNVAQAGFKARVISTMGSKTLQAWADDHHWPTVSPLSGAYAFDGNVADYANRMRGWLADLPDAPAHPAIIMCHPAASAHADDEIGPARAREFSYLASHDFVQDLRDAGVRLVRGSGQPMASI